MKKVISAGLCILLLCALSACHVGLRRGPMQLVNTLSGSLAGVQTVRLHYDIGSIQILPGKNDEIVVLEIADGRYPPAMYAQLTTSGDTLTVRQGRTRGNVGDIGENRVEVYLPLAFDGELIVDAEVGLFTIEDAFAFSYVEIALSVGDVTVSKIAPEMLAIDVEAGNVELTVPSDYTFTYSIQVELGEVDSSIVNRGSGSVGDNPVARVEITLEVGNIEVRQGR